MMLFFGGKETPFASVQRCFLPPEPPILPQTRFIQKNRQRRSVAAFPSLNVPQQEKFYAFPVHREPLPQHAKNNREVSTKNSGERQTDGCRASHDTRTAI